MFKVTVDGAISSLSVAPTFDDALAVLMPAVNNPNASGRIEDTETGEVLVLVENGNATHIAPEMLTMMLDSIYETDPELALILALGLLASLS